MSGDARPVIAIVGPTAVGKSELAVWLASRIGGEVVSADSRQVYRDLDIGTDKLTREQRRGVPHHLIDIAAPEQVFTLAQYLERARAALSGIHSRGGLPILTGGTGLYVRALLEGYRVPPVPPDPKLRGQLERALEREGPRALVRRLKAVDPGAARGVDPRNPRRLIRAMEVQQATGEPISSAMGRQSPAYDVVQIGLTMDRAALYRRIDDRVDRMMEEGFLEEVGRLAERGLDWDLPALSGIGYAQLGRYLRGETDLAAAISDTKRGTHRLVRQQYGWFRRDDPEIRWFDTSRRGFRAEVLEEVRGSLARLSSREESES